MQIDPISWKQMADIPQMNTNSTESATGFVNVLSSLLTEDSTSKPVERSITQLAPGVTFKDGLLWQQLGAVDDSLPMEGVVHDTGATKPTTFEDLITAAGERYGVPVSLIKAVIDAESSFNPNAVSSAGAKGLMQLMDGTARGLGVSNPFDPVQNIEGGTKYLSNLIQRFGGEMAMVLAAYNAGPTRIANLGVSSDEELMSVAHVLPKETQAYIGKVMNARSKYTL
ncbi:lytic transglycosylase domain-containing protein [Paenibacillus sp. p3-SID867]|uniref:lytic transglycosylase domain-containing protein n=1 Tax=Paenibacillus sp. p3-SID867 TaxID=2916363 RepID=UPI0021A5E47B|nr:lytic transglycosylase domain-containing protein [Paenibacillus sp. p3-SID867]MCT1397788.1 lytic transglycosylase domain-containing protein [Paenibacillus sp. p3-SID867]